MEFNSVWSVREDAGQDAFYILTPHYMEKLVALDRDKWMKMGIQFQPNGTLLIVMRDVDFFEAEESKSADELKEKLKNELLDLADTMERIGAATLRRSRHSRRKVRGRHEEKETGIRGVHRPPLSQMPCARAGRRRPLHPLQHPAGPGHRPGAHSAY